MKVMALKQGEGTALFVVAVLHDAQSQKNQRETAHRSPLIMLLSVSNLTDGWGSGVISPKTSPG
ncbi:hypothetical protein ANO14919_042350 [Xylariales sp. No.14919]|nr:hypothetical protein ANO14919_042350 [Xylariales sp. No.14919]